MTTIPIHRLSLGTEIVIPGYDAVEVLECDFDGSGYSITVCTNPRYGWDAVDHIYVEAGGSVEHAGFGHRYERPAEAVTSEEWEALNDASPDGEPVNLLDALRAKIDADNAATNQMLTQIAVIHADTAAMQAVMFPAFDAEGSEHQMGVAAE